MSTAPINVAITAQDFTSPAFTAAAAKAEAFRTSIVATDYSMREARASAMMLGEEIGVKLNRHLAGFLVNIPQIGSLMASAFSAVAIVSLIEYADKLYNKLTDAKAEADKLAQTEKLSEAFRKVAEEVAKIQAGIRDIGQTSQQVAINAMVEAQFALISLQARVSMQRSLADSLRASGQKATTKGFTYSGPGAGPAAGGVDQEQGAIDLKMSDALNTVADEEAVQIAKLQATLDKATALMAQSFIDLQKKASNEAIKAENEWVKAMDEAHKKTESLVTKDDTKPDKELRAVTDELAVWEKIRVSRRGINEIANLDIAALQKRATLIKQEMADDIQISLIESKNRMVTELMANIPPPKYGGTPEAMKLYKITTDQAYAAEQAAKAITHSDTAAQKYAATMRELNALLAVGAISQEEFSQAQKKASEEMNKHNLKEWKDFGVQIGANIEAALLFQKSWKSAFISIGDDLAKLILKMYVFQNIANALGGSNGGFFGNLFQNMAGLPGRASGGSVSSGMSYLVGEQGPELFTPGSSGGITPNGGWGGNTYHNYDMRGAVVTDELVRKAELASAMRFTEGRSVARSVAASAQLAARR
jgi:hypothetical protein